MCACMGDMFSYAACGKGIAVCPPHVTAPCDAAKQTMQYVS